MAKKPRAPAAPTTYELLGRRIQRVVNAPRAQAERTAVIARQEDESTEDWQRLLEELETLENVTMIPQDDGEVLLRWNPEEAL